MMEPIYIPRLLTAPKKSETLEVKTFLSGLDTLTPVRGTMMVTHYGDYLQVSANAETIKTLICDRSLQQYNQRLTVDTSELIWLQSEWVDGEPQGEKEVAPEELTESLPAQGYFDPETWLYEQFSLQLPMRQLSGESATGEYDYHDPPMVDQRWAALAALKEKLPNDGEEG